MITAPARVQAYLLARDVAQRVVQHFNALLGEPPVRGDIHLGLYLPGIEEVGVVYLQDEPCIRDGLVLLVHGVGDGVEELLFRGVVLVPQPVIDASGRDSRQEWFRIANIVQGGLEARDVALHKFCSHVRDRANTEELPVPGPPYCEPARRVEVPRESEPVPSGYLLRLRPLSGPERA